MANTYLYRDATSSTSVTKATISCWFKRGNIGSEQHIWFSGNTSDYGQYSFRINFNADNTLRCMNDDEGTNFKYETNRKFRDTTGYYHICLTLDQTNGTAADRAKLWINGVRETSFSTQTNMSGDQFFTGKSGYRQVIGRHEGGADGYLDGVLSHYYYIDGTAYDADTFGETDATTGEWKIKTSPTVTMGTNGFAVLKDGNTYTDQSSNSNDLTLGGGSVTKTEDCPSNLFASFNPLNYWNHNGTLRIPLYSNANWTANFDNASYNEIAFGNLGVKTGKYYWEVKATSVTNNSANTRIGVGDIQYTNTDPQGTTATVYYQGNGAKRVSGSETSYGGDTYTTGDVIGVALDMDNRKIYFAKNGTWQDSGDPTSGSTGTGAISLPTGDFIYTIQCEDYASSGNRTMDLNTGNGYFGTTAISSEGTNASGIGKFEYDVPTGYTSLSTKGFNE